MSRSLLVGFRAPNWDGVVGLGDESSAGVQLAKDKARRGTADGAIIAREEGEEWRNPDLGPSFLMGVEENMRNQLNDKALSRKKGYLYFSPTLEVVAARTRTPGGRRLAIEWRFRF